MWKYGHGSEMGNTCYQSAKAEHEQKMAEAKKKYYADKDVEHYLYSTISRYKNRNRK